MSYVTKTNWSAEEVKRRRAIRDSVKVKGKTFPSLWEAWKYHKLQGPHQAFRKTLKLRNKLVFSEGKQKLTFTIVPRTAKTPRVDGEGTKKSNEHTRKLSTQDRAEQSLLKSIAAKLVTNLQGRLADQGYQRPSNFNIKAVATGGWRADLGKTEQGWTRLDAWFDRATGSKNPHLYVGFNSPNMKTLVTFFKGRQNDIKAFLIFPDGMVGEEPNLVYPSNVPRSRLKQLFVEQHDKRVLAGRYFFEPLGSKGEQDQLVQRAAAYVERILSVDLPISDYDQYKDKSEKQEVDKIKSSKTLTTTEKRRLLKSRIGQGQFKASLVKEWRTCAVLGCSTRELLRASHIKPWSISNNKDRLDPENGLLLVPTLDAAFDRGLISFAKSGAILISKRLSTEQCKLLGISDEMTLRKAPSNARQKFLEHHRRAHDFSA